MLKDDLAHIRHAHRAFCTVRSVSRYPYLGRLSRHHIVVVMVGNLNDHIGLRPLHVLQSLMVGGALGIENEVIAGRRSEEHTSELQSRQYLVCRLLLEK